MKALAPRLSTMRMGSVSPPKKQAAPFYLSPAWRQFIAHVIAKRGRRCEKCDRRGCRIFGDHVVEITDGGAPLDEANVMLLCGSCHTRKTAAARVQRQRISVSGGSRLCQSKLP